MSHPIPKEALRSHIAVLGKTGSGKSYAIRGAVEHLLDEQARVCIIDPTGAWWGLKSSANGKKAGYPVVIFGGAHADLPLGAAHGEAIAESIGTSSTPAIIDTSMMRVRERSQFFTDFADALVRKNSGPLHLVIDEAHVFAPQGKIPDPQSGAMLHAANNMVSLGRSRGLRIVLITQRPAKLHKDSLTQVETLIALRLIAPQDRKAVEEWIKDNADQEQGKTLITSLAKLKTGQGWIWAPELGVLDKVSFPAIRTFDSGQAPTDGATGAGPVLAPIDLDAISEKLKVVAREAFSNDPARLKKRIAELEHQVREAVLAGPSADKIAEFQWRLAAQAKNIEGFLSLVKQIDTLAASAKEIIETVKVDNNPIKVVNDSRKVDNQRPEPATRAPIQTPQPKPSAPPVSEGLTPSLQRVLDAVAWWKFIGQHPVERQRVCVVAGYSPKASTFSVYISDLIKRGLVFVAPGKVGLTEAGIRLANSPTSGTREDLFRMARSLLKSQEQRVFDAIYQAYPRAIERADVAQQLGLSTTASTISVYLSKVSSIGLIEPSGRGMVKAADWLFP